MLIVPFTAISSTALKQRSTAFGGSQWPPSTALNYQ